MARTDSLYNKRSTKPLKRAGTNSGVVEIMSAARDEIDATITRLTEIRDDPKHPAAARVAASRTIAEMAGTIGRERSTAKELLNKSINEMSAAELEQTAELGRDAMCRLIQGMSLPDLHQHIALCQATLGERAKLEPVSDDPLG